MTSQETSHTNNVANELSFPLVTHTTHFDIRFGRYDILNSCFSSGHIMDRLDCSCSVKFFGHKMGETEYNFSKKLSQLSDAYSNTCF
jgi:hypothetical protein